MTSSFAQTEDTSFNDLSTGALPAVLEDLHGWKLEDAKAKFSEVVRIARDSEPQRITVRGEDAVVVLSSKTFAKVLPLLKQPSLHALLSESPLSRLDFEHSSTQSSVRDVEL